MGISQENDDGSLRKTNKAALGRELENNVSPANNIQTPCTTIIDEMSKINKLDGTNKMFTQGAEMELTQVL